MTWVYEIKVKFTRDYFFSSTVGTTSFIQEFV